MEPGPRPNNAMELTRCRGATWWPEAPCIRWLERGTMGAGGSSRSRWADSTRCVVGSGQDVFAPVAAVYAEVRRYLSGPEVREVE